MKKNISGFTIVELLVVIVVIAILAAISVVTYTGVQQRARDTIRKIDLANLAKALQMYNVDKGDWMGAGSGCGYGGGGWGWINLNTGSHSSYATTSINECLMQGGYIQSDITDPTGLKTSTPTTGFGYMKLNCGTGDSEQVFLYAKLEATPQSATAVDATCGGGVGWDTSYGMNYYVQVR